MFISNHPSHSHFPQLLGLNYNAYKDQILSLSSSLPLSPNTFKRLMTVEIIIVMIRSNICIILKFDFLLRRLDIDYVF